MRYLMNKRTGPLVAMLGLTLSLAVASPAAAQFRVFNFAGGGQWIETGTPPPDGDPSVIELSVGGATPGGYGSAMVGFAGVSGPPPSSSPTYDFRASATGDSGGSPRMTLRLTDGGAELSPARVVAGQWTPMDGQSDWTSQGGSCGYRVGLSYGQLLGCHPGGEVESLEIWNDSGWLYPDIGYQVLLDNVTYGAERISTREVDAITGPVERGETGEKLDAKPEEGTVLVKLPEPEGTGKFVPLPEVANVPVGSVVDTFDGEVKLGSAVDSSGVLESGRFAGGLFRIVPPRRHQRDAGITRLRLRSSAPGPCPAGEAGAARLVRRFSSDVRRRRRYHRSSSSAGASARVSTGGFQVLARHSTTTAHDAAWTTSERCDGTLTRVTRGRVVLKYSGRKRTVVLGAGEGRLARP
jgi:hypothetical protein